MVVTTCRFLSDGCHKAQLFWSGLNKGDMPQVLRKKTPRALSPAGKAAFRLLSPKDLGA
jgi:hypothetical protein